MNDIEMTQRGALWVGRFQAMASPCEVHMEMRSGKRARQLVAIAHNEAKRIERTFSRYRDDNIVYRINHSAGNAVRVDEETARLLDFADQCFHLSDGLFDVTSGVLRALWRFDGSDNVPDEDQIRPYLARIGWQKVTWNKPELCVPDGMQIDLGGIGKEYAVDRSVALLREASKVPFLVNFGGDLHASAPPVASGAWTVGIEAVKHDRSSTKTLELHRGALTTSGDAQRFLIKDGARYGHVLDPRTGWPVTGAPASITVAGNSCIEAGVLSTLGILHGENAETFLDGQGVSYWCQR